MAVPRILIVDDEKKITDIVACYMKNEGYSVGVAFNGHKALELIKNNEYNVIVLDLMLPDIRGEEICRRVRRFSNVPIIMLTAKVEERDLLKGFHEGADDYITKPFSPRELVVRVKALLRRSSQTMIPPGGEFTFNNRDLIVDCAKYEVFKMDKAVRLTPNEFKILTTFISHPGRVFSREDLITFSLGDGYEGYDRTIDTHIKNIRQKIETNMKRPQYIITVHGIGYKFSGDSDAC